MSAQRESSSLAPTLLLSMPQMQDENFDRTVVLLCDHTADGAFGLVLNRPTTTAAAEAVAFDPPIETSITGRCCGRAARSSRSAAGSSSASRWTRRRRPRSRPACTSRRRSSCCAVSSRRRRARTRVLTGYAGWGPGQLDQELAASAWLTVDVDPALIFDTPADEMWDQAIRRLGAGPGNLQIGQGVH